VRRAWADHETFQHVIGTSICLSCLLEAGRYAELQELLATRRMTFWSWHRYGAEALVRTGAVGSRRRIRGGGAKTAKYPSTASARIF
jgi:hypothetical protein